LCTDLIRSGYWLLIHWKKKDINMCISPNPGPGLSRISCEGGVTSVAVGGCHLRHVVANCLCGRFVHRRLLLGSHRARQPLLLQFGYIPPCTCTTMHSFIAISNLPTLCRGLQRDVWGVGSGFFDFGLCKFSKSGIGRAV
jgi:hypothetical protein